MNKPLSKPLNLQPHELTALEIILESYLKEGQAGVLSRVGDMHISKILAKVRRMK